MDREWIGIDSNISRKSVASDGNDHIAAHSRVRKCVGRYGACQY